VVVGAAVGAVVDGSVAGGWVVSGAVVGGAVVGASVVGGAVVAGSEVGGPVEPGGSCASAARMLAEPANKSPTVIAATTTARRERVAVTSSRRRLGGRRCLGWGRSENSSALKMANLPIQRTPKASSEDVMTIAVVTACDAAASWARALPRSAAQVERARPAKAIAQNGTTSFQRWERPRRPHAQHRFR
jgi:hypothetical protein